MMIKRLLYIIAALYSSLHVVAQSPTFKNSIGMEFVLIPPGKVIIGKFTPPYPTPADTIKDDINKPDRIMWMGNEGSRGYNAQEYARAKELAIASAREGFEVVFNRPYYMGRFEVTQDQWRKVMGSNPSTFQHDTVVTSGSHPVENISWKDANEFIKRLNRLEKTKRYRLPSEFEWEYAARGGRQADIPWNEITASAQLGGGSTRPVGLKKANGFGLYDVLGNVWEWVADCYNEKAFADPSPPKKGSQHVLKGASFTGDVKNATYLTHAGGPGNQWDVGFRVLMETKE